MSTITQRSVKGSPLTHVEVDNNFVNLNTDKYENGDSAVFSNVYANGTVTASSFSGDGSGLTGVTSYVKANFDSDFGTKDTDDLAEGATNKYYSDTLARAAFTGGTGVTLSGGGDISLNFSELTDMTAGISGTTEFILQNGSTESRKAASEIDLSNLNNDAGWTSNSGTVTSVGITAGNLIDVSGSPVTSSGNITVNVDLSELTTSTTDGDGDYFAVIDTSNAQRKLTKANIALSGFNNDAGWTSNAGTVTSVGGTGTVNGLTLTGTVTTSGNLTLGGTLSGISNGALTNSSITINGSSVSLGGTRTLVTDDIAEDGSPVNLWYTTARADSDAKAALLGGTGITYDSATGVIATNDGQIVHDNLSGFVANEHIDWTSASSNFNTSGSITLSGLSNQASETTAVMINGSNVVGTRELGSNAFNSSTIYAEPGIFSGGGTPTLASGVTAAEVRSLIGAGTSSTTGTVTSIGITAGDLIDVSGSPVTTSGNITVNVDLSELATSTTDGDGDYFAVVDTSNAQRKLTKANIALSGFNNDASWTSNTGTVTSVGITAGNLIDVSGSPVTTSGNITVNVDLSELATSTTDGDGDYFVVVDAANAQRKLTKANVALSGFNNDASWTSNTGTVTSVAAGNGLDFTSITGSGSVTLGTPGSLTDATSNNVTATSHTHAVSGFLPSTGGTVSGAVSITDTTASTTTATGALTIDGGLGVDKTVNADEFVAYTATDGSILTYHLTAWGTQPNTTLLHYAFASNLSDYLMMRVPGNTTGGKGGIVIADNGVYFGKSDASTGNVDVNSATVPFGTENWGYLNNSGLTINGTYNGDGSGLTGVSASFTMDSVEPSAPSDGDPWVDTSTGQLKVYYDDGSSQQWIVPAGQPGPAGPKGDAYTVTNLDDSDTGVIVYGDLTVDSDIYAAGEITAYSDVRLKSDIETLDGSKVFDMRGVSFIKSGKKGSGVIAQEMELVAPELVKETEYKSVAYGNITGYLIESVKLLKSEINRLNARIEQLEAKE